MKLKAIGNAKNNDHVKLLFQGKKNILDTKLYIQICSISNDTNSTSFIIQNLY